MNNFFGELPGIYFGEFGDLHFTIRINHCEIK